MNSLGIRIGRCVYCGDTKGELTREHIVPVGLGGDRTLTKASCKSCQAITHRFEEHCLQTIFGTTRQRLSFPSRRPRKDHFRARLRRENVLTVKLIEAEKMPLTLALPRLPRARIWSGGPKHDLNSEIGAWVYMPPDLELMEFVTGHSATSMDVGEFNVTAFCQLLAKIAHCHLVAEFGLDGFVHFTTDFIRGQNISENYYVGGNETDEPPTDRDVEVRTHINLASGLLAVSIRLFGSLGSPTYHVVGGFISTAHARLEPQA